MRLALALSNFKAFGCSLWPLWLQFSDAPIKFPNCGTMQQRTRITKHGRFNVGAGITNKGNVWETLHLWNRAHGSSTRDVYWHYVWNGTIYIDKKWIKQKTKKEANLPKLKWPEMYNPLASLNNPCSSEDHGRAAKPPKTLQETLNHKNQFGKPNLKTEETNVVIKCVWTQDQCPPLNIK